MKKKVLVITILTTIFAAFLCTWIYSTIPSPDVFDELITTDLLRSGCTNIVPHTITGGRGKTLQLEYRVVFDLDTTEPDLYARIDITIQPAWFYKPLNLPFISPFGGGDSSSLTTSDGKFEIIVEQSNHGMKGVVSPAIYTNKLAEELNRKYSSLSLPD